VATVPSPARPARHNGGKQHLRPPRTAAQRASPLLGSIVILRVHAPGYSSFARQMPQHAQVAQQAYRLGQCDIRTTFEIRASFCLVGFAIVLLLPA